MCNSELHNTVCMAFSLSDTDTQQSDGERAARRRWRVLKGAGVNEGDLERCGPRRKVIPH